EEILCQIWRDDVRQAGHRSTNLVLVALSGHCGCAGSPAPSTRASATAATGAAESFTEEMSGEQDDIGALGERQTGGQVADTLVSEPSCTHQLDDVECCPADVVSDHLQVDE